jgi:zinc transport system substrate-binding protein
MMRTKALLLATATAVTATGIAAGAVAPAVAAPTVATDIPPVHALAARVMAGVGEPGLILPPGVSPHAYSMKPSEAQLVQEADVVFWVGEELTPWLDRAVDALSDEAASVRLLEAPDVVRLGYREGVTFEPHDHGDEHGGEADHAHDEADAGHDHGHDETAEASHDHDDDHDHGEAEAEAAAHDHGHDHDHEGVDPHAWLDPVNGKAWLDAMAAALSEADPANASTYFQNAADGKAELDALMEEIRADLEPISDRSFVVFHDAYHYFEARFGIEATGAIRLGDAVEPGPRRVAEIREAIRAQDAACVFAEPQFEPRLIETVVEGTDAEVGVLDPLGADLELGPELYPELLGNLRDSLVDCLGA